MNTSNEHGTEVYDLDKIRHYTVEEIAKETVKRFRNQGLCSSGIDFLQNLLAQIASNSTALESLLCREINGVVPIQDIADFMSNITQANKFQQKEAKLNRKEQKMVMAASMAAALVTRRLMTTQLATKRSLELELWPSQAPDQSNKRVCCDPPDVHQLQKNEEMSLADTSSIDKELVETMDEGKADEMSDKYLVEGFTAADLNIKQERREVEKLVNREHQIFELARKSWHTVKNQGEYYQCVFEGIDNNKCENKFKYLRELHEHLRTEHFKINETEAEDMDYEACINCNRLFIHDVIQVHRHHCYSRKYKCKNLQHDVENADIEKLLQINVDNQKPHDSCALGSKVVTPTPQKTDWKEMLGNIFMPEKQTKTITCTEEEPDKSPEISNAGNIKDGKNNFSNEHKFDEKLQNIEVDGGDDNLDQNTTEIKEHQKVEHVERIQDETENVNVFDIESKKEVKKAFEEQLQNCKEAKDFLQNLVDSGGLKNFLESFLK